MVLAMVAVNAKDKSEVNPVLAVTYEMYEGADKYIQVRQIPGCEDMTMEEIDAAYNEFKAEMKKQEEEAAKLKARRATMKAATMKAATNSKAAAVVKQIKENPLNFKVDSNLSTIETYAKVANDKNQPESIRKNHEAIARAVFNNSVDEFINIQ